MLIHHHDIQQDSFFRIFQIIYGVRNCGLARILFVPTPKHINKAKIKEEIEMYGRTLRLMRHFRNYHREFDVNPFKKKSKFNPKGDAAIEMYLSRLEEEILSLDGKISYSNMTMGKRNTLHLLRDDPSIIKKKLTKD